MANRVNAYMILVLAGGILLGAGSANAGRTYKRSLGLFYGSVSLAGLCYETSLDPQGANSLAYSIGSTGQSDIDFAQQVRLYFLDEPFRPYAGLGLVEILLYGEGAGVLGNVTGGGGIDFTLGKYNFGLELLFHQTLIFFPLGGGGPGVSESQLVPVFGAYLKREF